MWGLHIGPIRFACPGYTKVFAGESRALIAFKLARFTERASTFIYFLYNGLLKTGIVQEWFERQSSKKLAKEEKSP